MQVGTFQVEQGLTLWKNLTWSGGSPNLPQDMLSLGCEAGFEPLSENFRQQTCRACQTGYFKHTQGNSVCAVCPAGSISTGTGAVACNLCELAKYQPSAARTNCLPCSPQLNSTLGAEECSMCAVGCKLARSRTSGGLLLCVCCRGCRCSV